MDVAVLQHNKHLL